MYGDEGSVSACINIAFLSHLTCIRAFDSFEVQCLAVKLTCRISSVIEGGETEHRCTMLMDPCSSVAQL
jgi:hypothetical protein